MTKNMTRRDILSHKKPASSDLYAEENRTETLLLFEGIIVLKKKQVT